MEEVISKLKRNFENVVLSLQEDLKSIRTGRASSSLVENLSINAYNGQTKLTLKELATITNEGPSTLVVIPFDPSTLQDIEKAILASNLGFSPRTQANKIVLTLPALTQEQREKLIKIVNQKIEDKKNQLRFHRNEARKKIKMSFQNKEIAEDVKFRIEKEIDDLNKSFMERVQTIKENKESKIKEIG